DLRPAHGFALQAIGLGGATATEAGRRLGISKQAAGKTIDRLEELGYVHRSGDDADRRRKLVRLSPRGVAVLELSAMIFNDIRSRWAAALGAARLAELKAALRTMAPGEPFRLAVPGWFGCAPASAALGWRTGAYPAASTATVSRGVITVTGARG